jgi:CRP-like cAMP-binding protein
MDRIRRLEPLSRLPSEALDELLARAGELLDFNSGDHLYREGQHDDFVSYLLSGRVQRSMDGKALDILDADREPRKRPLDEHAQKRDTVRALSSVMVLRIQRAALEHAFDEGAGWLGDGDLEVLDIASDTSTDWHTRLLRSHIFLRLSAEVIQQVFDRMEEQQVTAGQEVIRQGEPGHHYYIVQTGMAEVLRKPSAEGQEMHLADVGPGEAFGEEALISGAPRNATVRMARDGTLMRLPKADFLDLVVSPLVQGVSARQGRWLVEQGGAWVDVRDGRASNGHGIQGALHLPMHLLRLQSRRLDANQTYVVCGEDVNTCLLAAFLLAERGFEAAYLEQPLSRVNLEINQMNETKDDPSPTPAASAGDERLPRDEFAETTTGEELADLIDELTRQRDALGEQGAETPEPHPHDLEMKIDASAEVQAAIADASPAQAEVIGLDPREIVSHLLRDVDRELTRSITESLGQQRDVLATRLAQQLGRIERVARNQVHVHERQIEARYAERLKQKERELAAAYDRLTSLANRISHQKADIQKSRKALEEMLQTASRVHQEVFRVGNALVEQIGHLDDLSEHLPRRPRSPEFRWPGRRRGHRRRHLPPAGRRHRAGHGHLRGAGLSRPGHR